MALLSPVSSRPCVALGYGYASPAPLSLSRLHSSMSASVSPSCSSAPLRSSFCGRCLELHCVSPPPLSQRSRMAGTAFAAALTQQSIHDFTVKDIDGKNVSLSSYKGKVLLIVNVASRCGLTTSNYTELAQLYKKLKGQAFEILAFPCNQFAGQEPGSNRDIKQFACSRFKAEYPIFDKVEVNGFNTAPVYKYLKANKSTGFFGTLLGDNIKWNFEKFLVDKDGFVIQRFEPTKSPLQIEKDIRKLLSA